MGDKQPEEGANVIQLPTAETATVTDVLNLKYRAHMKRQKRARDTIQSYDRYVKAWEDFWVLEYGTTNPVLSQITAMTLLVYQNHLITEKPDGAGFTNRNANKYVGAIQAVLKYCGTQADWSRVENPPKIEALPQNTAAPKYYFRFLQRNETAQLQEYANSDVPGEQIICQDIRAKDQLSALYKACEVAWWPTMSRAGKVLDPTAQWRAALVMFGTYGFRTEELINYSGDADADPLTHGQVSYDPEMPQGGFCENRHGWFWYVPTKQKQKKPEPLVLPLNQCAAWHLKSIRPSVISTTDPIFNWPRCRRDFYDCWKAILKTSKIKLPLNLAGKPVLLYPKHMRKTCDTWYEYHKPGTAALITGHAPRSVVHRHYINGETLILEAVNTLPVPEAWMNGMRESTEVQKTLF